MHLFIILFHYKKCHLLRIYTEGKDHYCEQTNLLSPAHVGLHQRLRSTCHHKFQFGHFVLALVLLTCGPTIRRLVRCRRNLNIDNISFHCYMDVMPASIPCAVLSATASERKAVFHISGLFVSGLGLKSRYPKFAKSVSRACFIYTNARRAMRPTMAGRLADIRKLRRVHRPRCIISCGFFHNCSKYFHILWYSLLIQRSDLGLRHRVCRYAYQLVNSIKTLASFQLQVH